MKTDYQNINGFESLTIVFVVIGLLLTGMIFFASLAPKQQTEVVAALDVLDARQQVAQTFVGMRFVYDSQQEFFDQFYIAFTQVAVINPDNFKISFHHLVQASSPPRLTSAGQVLGESVDHGALINIIPPESPPVNDFGPASPSLGGPPVDWQALKQNLVKFYKSQ